MADDDLLLTNKYTKTRNNDKSTNEIFSKLMNAKKNINQVYSDNPPEFAETIKVDTNTGLSVNENSVAFEQYIKFAQTDKKKKIKKTILNIDSKNRNKLYTFDSISIDYTDDEPIQFEKSERIFTIDINSFKNLNKVNYIDDTNFFNQLIFRNVDENEANILGISKESLEFNVSVGKPIFDIIRFEYVTENNVIEINSYDNDREKYRYNRLILSIPSNIDEREINSLKIGKGILMDIVTNVNISYPSPSHYFINLGKTFSNIYSIRLVSSEIPNTSYTFNENLITTNFGQYKLSTKQNNKLRWINKSDRVTIPTNSVNISTLFWENMPFLPKSQATQLHIDHFSKMQPFYDCSKPNNANYIENLKRLHSLIRVSRSAEIDNTTELNPIIPMEKRDYYFDNRYIGDFDKNANDNSVTGINDSPIKEKFNIEDTVFTYNQSLISKVSHELGSHTFYQGYLPSTSSQKFPKFRFSNFEEVEISFSNSSNSSDDFVTTNLKNLETPFMVKFYSYTQALTDQPEEIYVYFFYVSKIETTTNTLTLIPLKSYEEPEPSSKNSPFDGIASEKIYLEVFKNIPDETIFKYQKYKNDTWSKLKKYYIESLVGMKPNSKSYIITQTHLGTTDYDSIASDGPNKFLLEYKTYHTYIFRNDVGFKQVEVKQPLGSIGGYYLFLFFKDKNDETVSEISNIAKEYQYVKITDASNNELFYLLGKDIIFDIATNKFKIQIKSIVSNDEVTSISNTSGNIKIEFQNRIDKELTHIYIKTSDEFMDISNKIVRFTNKDAFTFKYIDYFVAGKVNTLRIDDPTDSTSTNVIFTHRYEVRYKYNSNNYQILYDDKSNSQIADNQTINLYEECSRIYIRDYIGNYIVQKYSNPISDSSGGASDASIDNQIQPCYEFDTSEKLTIKDNNFVRYFESNLHHNLISNDIIDCPDYLITGISNKNINTGISNVSFAKEFIEIENKDTHIISPKINSNSNKLPSFINLNKTSKNYEISDSNLATKYPVYELNIASGKYSADSIVKYMLGALDNLKSRVYDYSKGIFYTDSSSQKFIDLNNEFGINQESKFVISVDKTVNSISFKQYKKVFDSHRNTSIIKGQIAYYNEGFPYVYFNIPQVSLPNNSVVFMSGGGTLGNMGGNITRGEKNIIVPPNFRIRIRQLLPLPKVDSINSRQNLFAKEGFVDVEDNEIYNKFVDYINNAVSSNNLKDISTDYIVNEIFNINESGYLDLNNLSEEKLKNLKEQFTSKSLPKNSASITESNLEKSFVDNYGKNIKYDKVTNFNNEQQNVFTYNRTGLEYFGQALINGYNNEQYYKEYFVSTDELEDLEKYGDELTSGFETTFIQNELFMKLSDTNVVDKKNIIGRFTKVAEKSDRYGNIEADYDLFTDSFLNFKIGDIIIGLDSNTIGIILPYDYKYNSLPNNDLIALGAGAYLMNKSRLDAKGAFEKYVSITNTNENNRDLAKKFITKLNDWQIERNKTNRGFYVYSSITPNSSKLSGTRLSNFQLFIPRAFKFLEDDDTALDKFGLKNSINNNKFSYFKTNYEANHEVSIKRSFFNIAKNNDIYTDYVIFETKSIDNFSVNDRIFIEDHQVISKDADFRREKFFNVELIENFASFSSKLETIYNNTVQNYNGFSGIGTSITKQTGENETKYLTDKEYKYDDISPNFVAKATAVLDAQVESFVVDSVKKGTGYTGEPKITIESLFANDISDGILNEASANATIATINDVINGRPNGRIDEIEIAGNLKGSYKTIPLVSIETPDITASVTPVLSALGEVNVPEITINDTEGFGYTEAPDFIVSAAPFPALTATADLTISGISDVEIKSFVKTKWKINSTDANSADLFPHTQGRIEIQFSQPADNNSTNRSIAQGYIEYNFNEINDKDKIKFYITRSGNKYNPSEEIDIFKVTDFESLDNNDLSNAIILNENRIINDNLFDVIVKAIGEVTLTTQGNLYYSNSKDVTDNIQPNNSKILIEEVTDPITGSSLTTNLSNVHTVGTPTVTINDTDGSGAIITPVLQSQSIIGFDIIHGGKNYTSSATISIDAPRALFNAKIDSNGRLSIVDTEKIYSPATYTNPIIEISNPKELATASFNDSGDIVMNNKGKGYIATDIKKGSLCNESFFIPQEGLEINVDVNVTDGEEVDIVQDVNSDRIIATGIINILIDGSSTPPTKIKKITIIDGKEGFIIPKKKDTSSDLSSSDSYIPDTNIYNNELAYNVHPDPPLEVSSIQIKKKGQISVIKHLFNSYKTVDGNNVRDDYMLRFLTNKYVIPNNISVNGFNGTSYSTINTGKITSIDLVRNNFEFRAGANTSETPVIIIKHPNFDTGDNEQQGKNRFLTLSMYKHSRGYIEMERLDTKDTNLSEKICTFPKVFERADPSSSLGLTDTDSAFNFPLVFLNTLIKSGSNITPSLRPQRGGICTLVNTIQATDNSYDSNFLLESTLGQSALKGPDKNFKNKIKRIVINHDHPDWDDFIFTSPPEIFVYSIKNTPNLGYYDNKNPLTELINPAANINEETGTILSGTTGFELGSQLVSVKANIENGTIRETIITTEKDSIVTSEEILFNSPSETAEATAEIDASVKSIDIYDNGIGYENAPIVNIESPLVNAEATAVVNSDTTISRIEINNPGAGYDTGNLTTVSIDSPSGPSETTATAEADAIVLNGNLIGFNITNPGSGYNQNNPPTVTISFPPAPTPPPATATATINESDIKDGKITKINITASSPDKPFGGSGYKNIPKITIDEPTLKTKIPIPFKNKDIYRYFNQDSEKYSINFYLKYKSSGSPNSGEFSAEIDNSQSIHKFKLKIENEFDYITANLNTGDVRNNLCVITISNDTDEFIFTRTNVTEVFKTNSSFTLKPDEKYYINIKTYRPPIAVDEIRNIKEKSSDGSHKIKYIHKYSTLGIFQRILDEQMNKIFNNMNYNIIKATELYRTYSYNIYRNRIIKLKVCPIDEKGFGFENCRSDGVLADETLLSNRQVKGYSKKLFPFHEYDIIQSYDKSEFGRDVDIIGTPYKSYRRVQQNFENKETTSKSFLPGMGVYVINDENITNGTQVNNTHYNSTSVSKNINLFYSEYRYDTQLIGFVLGTSINSRQEYDRNYRLRSDNFSQVNNDESVHSEYYIYMLIDPDITSSQQIDQLFNILNQDNINIVFDANSNQDYSQNPLIEPGYVTTKNAYYVNSQVNNVKTKSDDKQFSILKNIYDQRSFMNEQNVLKFFEDESYTDEINRDEVDAFLGLTASAITIYKPKLNKTLPYYSFQTRMACATIIERPVVYEKKDDLSSRKLFNSGDYDYYYKHYMENKTVMRYNSILETKNIDVMNRHNIIINETINQNHKSNNFKETDCHSGSLDPNINKQEDFFNIGNTSNLDNSENINYPELQFNNGEDIILVDAYKRKFSYEDGDVDYQEIRGRGEDKLGIQHTHIKVLTSTIIPPLYFNHNRIYDNKLNNYCKNASILDYDFDSGIERITYNSILGKYKPDKIDIVGNNSSDYDNTVETDFNKYNRIFITSFETRDSSTEITIAKDNITDNNYYNKFVDYLIVIDSNFKSKNETQPIDETINCELAIINSVVINSTEVILNLNKKLRHNHLTNIDSPTSRSFLLYPTFKLSHDVKPKVFIITGFTKNGQDIGYNIDNDEIRILDSSDQMRDFKDGEFNVKTTDRVIDSITIIDSQSIYQNTDTAVIMRKNLITPTINQDTHKIISFTNDPNIDYDIDNDEIRILDSSNQMKDFKDGEFTVNVIDGVINSINVNGSQSIYEAGDTAVIVRRNVIFPTIKGVHQFRVDKNTYDSLYVDDYLIFDWGKQRNIIKKGSIPYDVDDNTNPDPNGKKINTMSIVRVLGKVLDVVNGSNNYNITIETPHILYPAGTRVIIMKNNSLGGPSKLSENLLSTQPFTINNEWYTRIFYKGASFNLGKHFDYNYQNSNILPNLISNSNASKLVEGGTSLFNKNYSNTIFISGMKGIKIPFDDPDDPSQSNNIMCRPLEDYYYDIIPDLDCDFSNNSFPIIKKIKGEFTTQYKDITNLDTFSQIEHINNINKSVFIENDKLIEYPSIIVKGLFLGYGGCLEERVNQDSINGIINKSTGTAIKKIHQVDNKFYIYLQLSSTFNNLLTTSNLSDNYNLVNQNTRKDYFDYELNLKLLDKILEDDDSVADYEQYISVFGKGGKMLRKIIKSPYDLNPNNYIYMVIPNLNHITPVQNNSVEGAFAKILLPGESNKTLFSSFVAGTKIFNNNLFNNLNELEVTFITNEGFLFDFNGSEHSFSIEITEIIDKLEYINPRFGNIEF